jgi:arsenite methyltransferase
MFMTTTDGDVIRERVRESYGAAADRAAAGLEHPNELASGLYADAGLDAGMEGAVAASLGCANPTALVDLQPGETVLDLGSGAGLDVLLSARRVGPSGRAIGLDMTDEMLALAEANLLASGLDNVQFLRGHIEDIPLEDATVDVVISNCVLSLSAQKDRVLAETYRVLIPGGRVSFADLATLTPLPAAIQSSLAAWVGCIAGAMSVHAYGALLTATGFVDVEIRVLRTFGRADVDLLDTTALGASGLEGIAVEDLAAADGQVASVHVSASKPAAGYQS